MGKTPKKSRKSKADETVAAEVPASPDEYAGREAALLARIATLTEALEKAEGRNKEFVQAEILDVEALLQSAGDDDAAKIGKLSKELKICHNLLQAEQTEHEKSKLAAERALVSLAISEKDVAELRAKERAALQQIAGGVDDEETLKDACLSIYLNPAKDAEETRNLESKACKGLLPGGKQYDGKEEFAPYFQQMVTASNERGTFMFDTLHLAAIGAKAHFMSFAVLATRKDIEKWKTEQIQLRLVAQRTGDEDELKRLDHQKELNIYLKRALIATLTPKAKAMVAANEANAKSTCGLTYMHEIVKTFLPDDNEIICKAIAELATLKLEDVNGDVGEYVRRQLENNKWLQCLNASAGSVLPFLQAQIRKCTNTHFQAELRVIDAEVKAKGHRNVPFPSYLDKVRAAWEELPVAERKPTYAAAAAARAKDTVAMVAAKSAATIDDDAGPNQSMAQLEAHMARFQSQIDKLRNKRGNDPKGNSHRDRRGKRSYGDGEGKSRHAKKGRRDQQGHRKPHGLNPGDKWFDAKGGVVFPNQSPKELGLRTATMMLSSDPEKDPRTVYWCSKCGLWSHRTERCKDLSDEQKKNAAEMDQKYILVSAMDINAFNAERDAEAALLAEAQASGESIDGSTVTDAFESANEDMDIDSIDIDDANLSGLLSMTNGEQFLYDRFGEEPSSP